MSNIANKFETTREMKDSGIEWIGVIPKEWSISPLKSAIKAVKVIEEDNQNVLSLGIKGVKQRDISKNDGMLASNYSGHQSVFPGQLVFCPRDLDGGLLVGVSKYYGCISNLYMVFDSLKESDNQFIEYLIRGAEVCDYWIQHSYGMRYSYNRSQFLGIPVPIPSLNEQQSIANYLDEQVEKIDELIAEQNQAIENWKAYKQSLITEKVTKGLNPSVEMKDSGIEWMGDVPEKWKIVSVKYLFEKIFTGNSLNDSEKNIYSTGDEGHPYISTKDIDGDNYSINYKTGLTIPYNSDKFKIAQKNSILLCIEGGSAGRKISITDRDVCFVNKLCSFHSSNNLNKYLFYLLASECFKQPFFLKLIGLIGGVSVSKLKEIKLPITSLFEQQAIANYLDEKCLKIDQMIEQKQVFIKQLEEYKQSLIYECVTGKRCVL